MAAAPASAAPGNGPALDLDVQAVEGIPKDTLVALLKRKDKEAKGLASKLDKLEERYVKVVRFNKILMEDRTSFLRFCAELIPESEGTFEQAAAQETPVDLEALLQQLAPFRTALKAAAEDHEVLQQFAQLVFPGDEAVAQLFEGSSLGTEAFNTLQKRWVALEDLQNQSMASINAMAREQMLGRSREIEEAVAARRETEKKVEELREQLTNLAREKAQMLTQRLQGGGAGADAAVDFRAKSMAADGAGEGTPQSGAPAPEPPAKASQLAAPTPAATSTPEAQALREALEEQRGQLVRLQHEADRLREDNERLRSQSMQLVADKDAVTDRLQVRVNELEEELGSNAFINRIAEQQAGRETEMKSLQRQTQQLTSALAEIQRLLAMSYNQERVLKDRIRELEASQGRGHVASDYLKHVVLKYVHYVQRGDLKAQPLVPVICTLLNLTAEERKAVERPAVPTPLLLFNQAVGQASSILRGDGGQDPGILGSGTTRLQGQGLVHPALAES